MLKNSILVFALLAQIVIGPGSIGNGTGPGSATWGAITGTLSDQTDLQTALDTKLTTSTLGANVATWLVTPSSANLASAVTEETGSGALVFGTGPTITLANGTALPLSTGISGFGTNVATALAVNIGSAGAPVLFNGVLGTPSSGTLTNATGLPIAGITGLGSNVNTWLATAITGTVRQVVTATFTAAATGTTQIPADNTIPQNTEGDEYMTLAITPTNASSTLIVRVSTMIGVSTSTRYIACALFRDTTADAVGVTGTFSVATNSTSHMSMEVPVSAASTSATTFKVRVGLNSTGTVTFNGANSARIYGAIPTSTMSITEILP